MNFISGASLSGIAEISATIILAEIGVNMNIFDDTKHLCSWCGLSTSKNESARKKKSVSFAKACAYFDGPVYSCCNQVLSLLIR